MYKFSLRKISCKHMHGAQCLFDFAQSAQVGISMKSKMRTPYHL